jgi:hypothetical protein
MSATVLLREAGEWADEGIRFRSGNYLCSSDPEVQETVPLRSRLAPSSTALVD